MTKQEEVWERVESIIRQSLDKGKTSEQITDLIFAYQHLQGCVLKVDKELPENPAAGDPYDSYGNGYNQAQEDMAGYTAWEPIIKKEENNEGD